MKTDWVTGTEAGVDRRGLEEVLGEPIAALECRPSADRSTHPLERVRVTLRGGRGVDLMLKATREPPERGAFVRPACVRDVRREPWAYESLLHGAGIGTPRFHGLLDEGTPGERLVIEAVAGRPLSERGEREPWTEAARWLARFHVWGASRSDTIGPARRVSMGPETPLLRQSAALHRLWWRRAVQTGSRTPHAVARLRSIRREYARAVRLLAGAETGLVHGEFYPSNILVERRTGGWAIRPIDWESVGIGPIALDLAALLTGWNDEDRSLLIEAYGGARTDHPGMTDAGEVAASRPSAPGAAMLAAARMVNAMQWLGWSAEWRPPSHHARDWLAEAEAGARALRAH